MSDLIPFTHKQVNSDVIPVVDGRNIHTFLELSRDYNDWIRRQIKRAKLVENRDYIVFYTDVENPKGGRPSREYHFTFDSAKHIGMLSGSDKGHEVREYFINKEKELLALRDEEERHPLVRQARAIARLEARQDALEAKVEAIESRRPPEGKSRVEDWLRRHSKPFLPRTVMKQLRAECRHIEPAEMFRPDGFDFAMPFWSDYTIARAYAEVTRQLSFMEEHRTRYA